jgi:PAS domain S-box-containing protein
MKTIANNKPLRSSTSGVDLLELVTDSLPARIAYIDHQGRYQFANRRYLLDLGLRPDQIEGRRVREILGEELFERVRSYMEAALSGETVTFETQVSFVEKERYVQATYTPDIDAEGRVRGFVALTLDVTDRRHAEDQLRRREAQLERAQEGLARLAAIIESSDDAIVSKTLEGVIVSWNRAAERMFGYTAAEAIGRNIKLIIPEERLAEEDDVLARVRRGEKVDHFETVRRAKDGSRIDISLTVSPIRDESGKIIGASKIARDITERRNHEAQREELLVRERQARQEAEQAIRLKDEFLSTLSHELRTPLNAIVGWAHMLRTGLPTAERERALDVITRNAMTQNQLIADILDVQRLRSGKLRLNMREVNVAGVISSALDTMRPSAQAKGIDLRAQLDPAVEPICGDPDRIQQIVWNLLSNAVKFTPNGGRIEIRLLPVNAHVEISVEDTGYGIDPGFLPYIFDRFRQADSSSTRRHGGLGLGLAIVRDLTELHGGSVIAANRPAGGGAVFTVALPRAIVTLRKAITDERGRSTDDRDSWIAAAPSLHGAKVLVVDDEPESRELVAMVLACAGADISAASSAGEALPIVVRDRPDAIICDIEMPGEDGYSFMKKVRALPHESGGLIPAAALTAYAATEDRLRALAAGFQIHVAKPVQPAELAGVVASLTGRVRR